MKDVRKLLHSLEIPDRTTPPADRTQAAPKGVVNIRGELVARTEQTITLSLGELLIEIPIEAVVDAAEDAAQPSPDQRVGAPVMIAVDRNTLIREIRNVPASSLGTELGLRPLAFAIPSESEKFTAVEPIAAGAGAAEAGISPLNQITVWRTTWVTPQQTPRLTGNTIDTSMDQLNDSQIDQRLD